jgi:hypothetical protein
MMHRHRRHGSGFPRARSDVEDLHRLRRLSAADQIEPLAYLDESGLESRNVLPHDLENVPPATTGLLRIRWTAVQRERRRQHHGR